MFDKFVNWVLGCTQISNYSKKTLIVNFKKSKDRQIKVFNLNSYEEYSFKLVQVEATEQLYPLHYKLIMSTVSQKDGYADEKVLAYFSQESHAKKALARLQNKIYTRPLLSVAKTLLIIFILYLFFSYILYSAKTMSTRTAGTSLTNEQIQQLAAEQQRKIEALQAQAAQQMNGQPPFNQGPGTLVPIPSENPPKAAEPSINFSTGSKEANGVLGALN